MATAPVRQRRVALEVHLPEQIGRRLLKTLVRRSTALGRNHPAMPAQDLVHRRMRRTGNPLALQAAHDLARSPGRVFVAHRHNPLLDRRRGALRARM